MNLYQIDDNENKILLNNGQKDLVKFEIKKIDNQNVLMLKIEKDISNIRTLVQQQNVDAGLIQN